MPYKELHECFANMVRGRRNRPLQETAIVLITTPKALLALAYIRTAQQVHAWFGVGDSGNDETELSLAAGPVCGLEFGLLLMLRRGDERSQQNIHLTCQG